MNAHNPSPVSPDDIATAAEGAGLSLAEVLAMLETSIPSRNVPAESSVIYLPAPAAAEPANDAAAPDAAEISESPASDAAIDFQAARDGADDIEPVDEELESDDYFDPPEEPEPVYPWEPLDDAGLIRSDLVAIHGEDNVAYIVGHGWYRRVTELPPTIETRRAQVSVARDDLNRALATAGKVIESRNSIPILSNVRIDATDGRLSVTGTDLDIEVCVTIPCDGDDFATTAPAKLLETITKRKKVAAVAMSFVEKTTTNGDDVRREDISFGIALARSRMELQTLPATDFPDMETGEFKASFTMPAEKLCDALSAVEFAISTEETRYYLNGVYFHPVRNSPGAPVGIRAVATDGHRLARIDLDTDVDGKAWAKMRNLDNVHHGIIVPRKAVATVLSHFGKRPKLKKGEIPPVDMVTVDVSETKIRFTCNGVTITSKLIDGTFPDYCRVIPAGNSKIMTVNAATLVEAIDTVTAISSVRGRAVKLTLSTGHLVLTVNDPETGSATEEIDCDYQSDGFEIGFNASYMLEILANVTPPRAKDCLVSFSMADAGAPALVESGFGPVCVLMPMQSLTPSQKKRAGNLRPAGISPIGKKRQTMEPILEYPLRAFLDLSTGHVSESTRVWLEDRSSKNDAMNELNWVAATPFGWFVYADEEFGPESYPDDLLACMKKARELGAEYILFDRDAAPDPEMLPLFD